MRCVSRPAQCRLTEGKMWLLQTLAILALLRSSPCQPPDPRGIVASVSPKQSSTLPRGASTAPPSLSRASLSDLQSSTSSMFSSDCCEALPSACNSQGQCLLGVSSCAVMCICAHNPSMSLCPREINRLQGFLSRRGSLSLRSDQLPRGPDPSPGHSDPMAAAAALDSHGVTGNVFTTPTPAAQGAPPSGADGSPVDDGSARNVMWEAGGQFKDARLSGTSAHRPSLSDAVMAESAGANRTGSPHQASTRAAGRGVSLDTSQVVDVSSSDGDNVGDVEAVTMSTGGTDVHISLSTQQNSSSNGHVQDNSTGSAVNPRRTSILPPLPEWCSQDCEFRGGKCILGPGFKPQCVEGAGPDPDWCSQDCESGGGKCVLGPGFKPQCVEGAGPDPCLSFNCMHGTCKESEGKFSCVCDKNWVGVRCEKECPLECGEHGYCGHAQNGSIACICNWNYTGTWCTDSWPVLLTDAGSGRTGEALTVWQVAAGCLGIVAVLLVLLVLLAYVTWRRQWLPMRKLVHYFQQYEEDDGKGFDAFVSYKSTARDETFVLQQLYPRLEKDLDFKLCLHFRDFPPGETIADNIIHAIENSRRTIMVLSPAYVQSEWCRLEYQKAQHEMLKLKHKIIPVVLEDVDHVSFVDKNLKNILDTVTYIKWPGPDDSKRTEKFWKLVELSMPKKKNDYTRSLSSTGSCSSEHPLTSVSAACFNTIVDSMSDSLSPQRSLSMCSSSEGTEADNDKDETGNERPRDDNSSDSEGDPSDQPSIDEQLVEAWSRSHVTSDDHIVEIREISDDVVRVTPVKLARTAATKSVHC